MKYQSNENAPSETPLEAFLITPIKKYVSTNAAIDKYLEKISNVLMESSVYEAIEIKKFVNSKNRKHFYKLMQHLKEKGIPFNQRSFSVYHYTLPSKGPHEAVHFLRKQSDEDNQCPD